AENCPYLQGYSENCPYLQENCPYLHTHNLDRVTYTGHWCGVLLGANSCQQAVECRNYGVRVGRNLDAIRVVEPELEEIWVEAVVESQLKEIFVESESGKM